MRESDLIRHEKSSKDKQIFEPPEQKVEPPQKEEKLEIPAIGMEQFVEFYSKGIEILHKISEMESLDATTWQEILDFISEVVDITVEIPGVSVDVAINHSGHPSLTRAHNIMDVFLLAINIGIGLGYSKDKLIGLGTTAFLHDIGMLNLPEGLEDRDEKSPTRTGKFGRKRQTDLSSEKSTGEQGLVLRQHPIYSLQKLEGIDEVTDDIKMAIYQGHERIDGSGYPEGVKGKEIHEYAQIIGIADTYQTLTSSSRAGKTLPHEAMKTIINYRKQFNPKIIKAFINQVSIYPIGSLIQLNNSEIAKIIDTNKNSPLRPKIVVLFDRNGKRLKDKKTIDLRKELIVHIKKSITPDEVGIDVSDILKI